MIGHEGGSFPLEFMYRSLTAHHDRRQFQFMSAAVVRVMCRCPVIEFDRELSVMYTVTVFKDMLR